MIIEWSGNNLLKFLALIESYYIMQVGSNLILMSGSEQIIVEPGEYIEKTKFGFLIVHKDPSRNDSPLQAA